MTNEEQMAEKAAAVEAAVAEFKKTLFANKFMYNDQYFLVLNQDNVPMMIWRCVSKKPERVIAKIINWKNLLPYRFRPGTQDGLQIALAWTARKFPTEAKGLKLL
jgi:hypothetical protein